MRDERIYYIKQAPLGSETRTTRASFKVAEMREAAMAAFAKSWRRE
jgi:hypothetical protein